VWSQCLPHGSLPNMSDRIRSAQFLKMFPERLLGGKDSARAKARAIVMNQKIKKAERIGFVLTDIGRQVFGLKTEVKKDSFFFFACKKENSTRKVDNSTHLV